MGAAKNPLVTVDAIIEREGEILFVKRRNDPFRGRWAFPGGFVEYGERVEDALKREVMEETGLTVRIKRFHNVYSNPDRDPRGHVISLCFVVEGIGKPRGGDDAMDARFFSMEEALRLDLAFDHEIILKDYMEKRHVL